MKYAKALAAGIGSVLTVLTAALADDVLSMDETGTLVSTLVTAALTVYAVFKTSNAA
jgi:hypothetical protein